MPSESQSVTVAVSRHVVPGKEHEFDTWSAGIADEAARFPGHLGNGYLKPEDAEGEYTVVYRFDSAQHLDAWLRSPQRARWIEESRGIVVGDPHEERATGLEYWFRDPGMPDIAPPVWKQALLTWVGLYPTVVLVGYTLGMLLGGWSLPMRSVFTSATTVVLMTWAVMPVLTRVSRGWLRPGGA